MERLLELLTGELERPRHLPAQVSRHLNATYGVSLDSVGQFINEQMDSLEDYEVDLILSPVFTPSLKDQALIAPILGKDAIEPGGVAGIIQQLMTRRTVATLVSDHGGTHRLPLREVSVARYVERLRLEGSIPDDLYQLIVTAVPEADQAMALAVARRAVWTPGRAELLRRYLQQSTTEGAYRLEDLTTLLRLVEMYEPADLAELKARLPGWIDAVRHEASAAGQPKPFFNERVEDMHGGGRDQRRRADPRAAAREAELNSYRRLWELLGK